MSPAAGAPPLEGASGSARILASFRLPDGPHVPSLPALHPQCTETGTVTRKADNSQLIKREIVLVDQSARTVRVTLWGKLAEEEGSAIQGMDHPVVAFKGLRVGDFGGVSLGTLGRTVVQVDPQDLAEANTLRHWYSNGGSSAPTTEAGAGLANAKQGGEGGGNGRKTLTEMQPEQLAPADAKPEWGTSLCTVLFLRTEARFRFRSLLPPAGAGCRRRAGLPT